jgi:RNA polymerase sigma-70 factor, ECF subfamily
MSETVELHQLVAQAKAGEASAISELYDRYAASLLRYLLARVYEAELAQDLTQEVFIRVIKGIGKFEYRDEKSFLGWLYAIATNVVMTHHRRRRLVSTPLDDQDERFMEDSQSETRRAFDRIMLQQAMDELTEDQQQVLAMRFFADMPNSEIAGILQRSEGAIKAIQHRALQAMQRILGRDNEEAAPKRKAQAKRNPVTEIDPAPRLPGLGHFKPRSGD